jgi:hypothetical protein
LATQRDAAKALSFLLLEEIHMKSDCKWALLVAAAALAFSTHGFTQ